MKNLDHLIDWKQEYENLRQEALQTSSRRGHGLALFLSRGMMAWLKALTALRSIGRSSIGPAARPNDVTGRHGVVVHDRRSP
jgi:hypothetical protein